MKNNLVKKFNNKTFDKCAILKIIYYLQKKLIIQHIPIKGRVKKTSDQSFGQWLYHRFFNIR